MQPGLRHTHHAGETAAPGRGARARRRRAWPYVAAYVLGVLLAAAGMHLAVQLANADLPAGWAAAPPPAEAPEARAGGPGPRAPLIAGTGAALPIVNHLVAAFARAGGGPIRVAPSIGSGGGLRALADGASDAALLSRPLRRAERTPDLHEVVFAEAPVVLVGGRNVPERTLTAAAVLDFYAGRRPTWRNGQPVAVVLREPGDSATDAFARFVPGFAATHAWAARAQMWRVAASDAAMEQELVALPGSLGLLDAGTLQLRDLPLTVIAVRPTPPAPAAAQDDGTAGPRRPFAFVLRGAPHPALAAFVAFVCGPAGRAELVRFGYAPVACGGVDAAR